MNKEEARLPPPAPLCLRGCGRHLCTEYCAAGHRVCCTCLTESGDAYRVTVPELKFYRADGRIDCTVCGKTYSRHPMYPLFPFVHIICNGDLVKL